MATLLHIWTSARKECSRGRIWTGMDFVLNYPGLLLESFQSSWFAGGCYRDCTPQFRKPWGIIYCAAQLNILWRLSSINSNWITTLIFLAVSSIICLKSFSALLLFMERFCAMPKNGSSWNKENKNRHIRKGCNGAAEMRRWISSIIY